MEEHDRESDAVAADTGEPHLGPVDGIRRPVLVSVSVFIRVPFLLLPRGRSASRQLATAYVFENVLQQMTRPAPR